MARLSVAPSLKRAASVPLGALDSGTKKILVLAVLLIALESLGTPARLWLSGGATSITQATSAKVLVTGDEASLAAEAQAWAQVARTSGNTNCRAQILCPSRDAQISSCEMDVTSCVPAPLRADLGRVFRQPGPNCFATALHGAGALPGYRAVDVSEMKSHARLYCHEVLQPEPLDLGVYVAPGTTDLFAESATWVHAFLWVTPEMVFEKQGVDYWGATPVGLREFRHVDYRVRASPECRRYAKDLAECANRLIYLRCSPPDLATLGIPALTSLLDRLEAQMALLIDQPTVANSLKQDAESLLNKAQSLLNASHAFPPPVRTYLQSRLESFRRQLLFLKSPSPTQKVPRTF